MSIATDRIRAIAVGNFDGMHPGHRALFDRLGEGGAVAVIEHYRATLTPGAYRAEHVALPLFFYDFSRIRSLSPESFVRMLHRHFPDLARIVVGEDFRFGADRAGDAALLAALFGGEVVTVEEVCYEKRGIHSRHIRKALAEGDLTLANGMLGRPYECVGEVIRGQGIGSRALVPTMNLRTGRFMLPAAGVYRTQTAVAGRWYRSVTFVGHRLSTDGRFAVETHLIDATPPSVAAVRVRWLDRLRANRRFESFEALKAQIEKDIIDAAG